MTCTLNWSAWKLYMERTLVFIEMFIGWLCKWSLDLRSLSYFIWGMLCFDPATHCPNQELQMGTYYV
jgi:hypothetical protein